MGSQKEQNQQFVRGSILRHAHLSLGRTLRTVVWLFRFLLLHLDGAPENARGMRAARNTPGRSFS